VLILYQTFIEEWYISVNSVKAHSVENSTEIDTWIARNVVKMKKGWPAFHNKKGDWNVEPKKIARMM